LQAIAHDAFRALVNLSESALLVPTLSEPDFLAFVVSYIIVRLAPVTVVSEVTIGQASILELHSPI
jgi:hypothetical protein